MQPGIYVLVIAGEAVSLNVGSLGEILFPAGYYCYIGSALGPGGLARVSRHIRLAKARDRRPRWHIDYLLIHPEFRLVQVYCVETRKRLECCLAGELALPAVSGFGSSDCTCPGHLFYSPAEPGRQVLEAFGMIGLHPDTLIL